VRLQRAQSCEDLEALLKRDTLAKMNAQIDAIIASYSEYGYGYSGGGGGGVGADDAAEGPKGSPEPGTPTPTDPSSGSAESASNGVSAPAHSDTNTQVAGVDEADIVKTDGNNIYLLHGQSFYTLNAWPASSLAVGSSLAVEGAPFEMFVADDKVVIYSSVDGNPIYEGAHVAPRPEYYDYGYGFGYGVSRPTDAGTASASEDGGAPSAGGGSEPSEGGGATPPEGDVPPDSGDVPPPDSGDVPPPEGDVPPDSADPPSPDDLPPPPYGGVYAPLTKITVLSLAGGSPSVARELYFEGGYASARRVAEDVRTVLTGGAHGPALSYWPESLTAYPPTAEAWTAVFEQLRADNTAAIQSAPLSTWLPYRFEKRGDAVTEIAASCSDFYVPDAGTTSYGLTQIESIDLGDLTRAPASTSIIGATDTVYSNQDALYVAARGWQKPTSPGGLREDLENFELTHLHKFDLATDPSQPRYVASGSVPGYILNQFSLDEKDGKLRISTTEDLASATEWTIRNNVFVLEASGAELSRVGAVEDLAPGERIQSTRFVGDRGYVVTFRRVDPLFVIDLADPASPSVAGELEIPGFSEYMHPIDDGHLLTIGKDGTAEGQVTGLALQIFDVTDPSSPALLHKQVLGAEYAYSEAEYNHKAFTYYGDRGLLAFPLVSYAPETGTVQSTLQLFHVDTGEGFRSLGAVDHSAFFTGADSSDCYGYYSPEVRRGLFIESYVYSISYGGVLVSSLDDVATPVASLALPAPTASWGDCGGGVVDGPVASPMGVPGDGK
jgi:hypothetical protein